MEEFIKILSDNPSLFQAIIDNIPSPVYYKDTNGVYLIYNSAFREYFNLGNGQFVGKNVFGLPVRREEASFHDSTDKELLRSPGSRMYESVNVRPDGAIRYELIRKATFSNADGTVGGIVGMIIDTTEQKRMEEDLLKASNIQSLATLAGGIAHDFNNLLMAIVGNLSLAKMNVSGEGQLMGYLREAERIAFLGKSLTQQLLTFSRGGDTVRSMVQVGPLVKGVTEKVLAGSPVRCEFIIPEDILPVEADGNQIGQVIENIVLNAKESMPSGGKIKIQVQNTQISPEGKLPLIKEEYIRISITDEGRGIAQKDISKIFDPYYTTKGMGSQKGVGLGLAISFAIIKKHKGYISVESVEGIGTTFHVNLPAGKREVISEEALPKKRVQKEHKGRVLILDDEEMILNIAKELLKHLGYFVKTVQAGEDAISFYRQAMEAENPFDAVILDLAIPEGIGGREVLLELMRIDPNVKAIISSGYLNDPIVARYREYGFLDVLTKPYNTRELDEKLKKLIEKG